ncbi:protein-associating with the carboxyl-terminal domain of ezrin [Temnothorax longispinosus]|uniref:protein-associating with the carboxyl-terminal domain of ezrin n=1 Tax=Temnothorax longispinosus TaxID=300112 RepID=UPI003A99B202
MGNERSALRGLEIENKAVEVTDYWMHYDASVRDSLQKLSIFISEPSLHFTATFGRPSPLERAAKNFMLHRHPCILKYISSWSKGSKFFLATEEARPLIQVIEKQNVLQICIGLHSILRALVFLHETALASHNNVCSSSIYVTAEGCWKLGGLECLCKLAGATPTYYQRIKSYRYEKAISSNEDVADLIKTANLTAIDSYAFGVLAEDILKNLQDTDEAIPNLLEFKEFCKKNLQNPDACLRSRLFNVLQHSFFTHEFIRIHAFLEELPLKTDVEREEFFTKLRQQLQMYPEAVVAEQLGRVLLSRIVLLDSTAQVKLLPFIFKPKDEKNDLGTSLFTVPTFKSILVPRLLQMFCIRDVSIRLLLLSHFNTFVHVFETEELKNHILPELLVGIKDTNDDLVSATLRALADVVPILGAATVIGGNRGKLFTDGRPNKKMIRGKDLDAIRKAFTQEIPVFVNIDESNVHLAERPSPDGGEDKREKEFSFPEEECTWSDWETQEPAGRCSVEEAPPEEDNVQSDVQGPCDAGSSSPLSELSSSAEKPKYTKKLVISDITELDIKNSKVIKSPKEEIDFFTDMEPVIRKTQILHVPEEVQSPKSMFDVKASGVTLEEHDVNGWGEDLSDLSIDDTYELAQQ